MPMTAIGGRRRKITALVIRLWIFVGASFIHRGQKGTHQGIPRVLQGEEHDYERLVFEM
jgi:hypothetical protein